MQGHVVLVPSCCFLHYNYYHAGVFAPRQGIVKAGKFPFDYLSFVLFLIWFCFDCSNQVYDLTQLISALNFKSYPSLSYIKRVEWNNRWLNNFLLSAFSFIFHNTEFLTRVTFAGPYQLFMRFSSLFCHYIWYSGQICMLITNSTTSLRFEVLHCPPPH